MMLTARDVMTTALRVVNPEMSLPELERAFIDERVHGFPVVENGRLVGIVSRSDIVRQLCVEQSLAEMISDYYREGSGYENNAGASLQKIGDQVGERMERLRVCDVMTRAPHLIAPETPIREVARLMVEADIHRIIVGEGGRMVGLITSGDLVRLIAQGRLG